MTTITCPSVDPAPVAPTSLTDSMSSLAVPMPKVNAGEINWLREKFDAMPEGKATQARILAVLQHHATQPRGTNG
ncbi:MAG: hypothetical protein H3C62_02390 [Gemmatimonadaceae bacterium]|nr:hypothetical protein [Gemmatimonadaceae bacterium]